MGITNADANNVLKDFYSMETNLKTKLRGQSPTFDRIKIKPVGSGRQFVQPVQTGSGQAVASDYAEAYRQAVNEQLGPRFQDFKFTWDSYHAHWSFQVKAKKQMKDIGPGSFINGVRRVIDSARETAERMRYQHLFGNGRGYLARIAEAATGQAGADFPGYTAFVKIYLRDLHTLPQFEAGTRFVMIPTSSATTAAVKGSTTKIFECLHVDGESEKPTIYAGLVQPASGVVAADLNIPAGAQLYRVGDLANKGNYMVGFEGWCPSAVTTLGGQTRVSGGRRIHELAGFYFNATGAHSNTATDLARFEHNYQRLLEASALAYQRGARPKYYVVNPKTFRKLIDEGDTGAKVESKTMSDGLPVYSLHGAGGYVNVYVDAYCPADVAYGLEHDDWCIVSLGPFLDPLRDGGAFDRVQGKNLIEGAISSYATLVTRNPLNLVRVDLQVS